MRSPVPRPVVSRNKREITELKLLFAVNHRIQPRHILKASGYLVMDLRIWTPEAICYQMMNEEGRIERTALYGEPREISGRWPAASD